MFRFCDRTHHHPTTTTSSDVIPYYDASNNTGTDTCPVIVHFPIGREPCQTCSDKWHLVIPDNQHAKPVSNAVWNIIHQVQRGIRPSATISQNRWDEIRSKNCTLAYVSSWSEKKGQERLAQKLSTYSQLGLLQSLLPNNDDQHQDPPLTICFAGSSKSETVVQKTLGVLASLGIAGHDLGLLTLVEQIVLFAHAGKSILLTRSDHSPRVVYLSLASGARVLTTERAQVAAPVIDNDCLVTELPFFDNSTTVSERATIMRHFLLTNDDNNNCTNHTQTTRSKAYGILREELQYGPIVRQALEMWRTLNFAKEGTNNHFEDCLDLFAVECDQYRKQRGR